MSGDQEPWVFRGGLVADLQRLIPLDAGNDLYLYKLPETSAVNLYTIRPYVFTDEVGTYRICNQTMTDEEEIVQRLPDALANIYADRHLGPFLTLSPEFCMIVEDNSNGIVGYACAAIDAKIFFRNIEQCWIPEMCVKYPLSLLDSLNTSNEVSKAADSTESSQTIRDCITYFHNFKNDYPANVCNSHPSVMCCRILKSHLAEDETVCKRIITVLLAALRSNGSSFGVHVCIDRTDRFLYQFYSKLGFAEIYRDETDCKIYLGRNF